ncbi:MAG: ABC transporter permease [Thermosynechococcaceae cyanobacterium MS004]|nr:ABC transporter permease [Thermosynechococcaceae cyanobacterium MS004]
MVSIARKNLFQDLPRFIVAQAGILFAVGLVSIQTGLLNGFTRSTSQLIKSANADIWLASKDIRHLEFTLPIPYERLQQARGVQGVERAEALITQGSVWRYGSDGSVISNAIAPIRVIGFDPNGQLFQPLPLTQGQLTTLTQPYTLILDQSDLSALSIKGVGNTAEIGSYRARVVGLTKGIRSIVSSPFAFTSLPNANAYLTSPIVTPQANPPTPRALGDSDRITYVLIRAQPGENIEQLKQRLEANIPDVKALTQAELTTLTENYWRESTGVGFILGLGAVVGVVVGIVVVGQILYSSVTDHLKEFGTLKAMGSSDWFIYKIILEQALWMAVLGYLPGMGLVLLVGSWTQKAQAVQILVGPMTAGGVFGLTVLMCCGAAIFAIQKVTRLDPAMVFKS